MKETIKRILGRRVIDWLRHKMRVSERIARKYFDYDMKRLVKYSGCFDSKSRDVALAGIILQYHIIEKGLTMPNRRFLFGRDAVNGLMDSVKAFENKYGSDNAQVNHAAGVVKAYLKMHMDAGYVKAEDSVFWKPVMDFASAHESVPISIQPHYSREQFYDKINSPFPEFAKARHTLRHYSNVPLRVSLIRDAVALAMTAPSACNRQYSRVHCISDKVVMAKILAIQGGNRGFGHLADKLLVVTVDLEGLGFVRERNDLFTNGGMFLMNLCYALYYYKIAHCILNWSRTPEEDLDMRKLVKVKDSETVIAILTCGETPDEFDVASSPRKEVEEIFVEG